MSPSQLLIFKDYIKLKLPQIKNIVIDETSALDNYIRLNVIAEDIVNRFIKKESNSYVWTQFYLRILFYYKGLSSEKIRDMLYKFNESIEDYNFYIDTNKTVFFPYLIMYSIDIFKEEKTTDYIGKLIYKGRVENKYTPLFVIENK